MTTTTVSQANVSPNVKTGLVWLSTKPPIQIMKIKSSPKYQFGQVFKREGKCPLRICGFTHEGEYVLSKVLRAVSDSDLSTHFHSLERKEGAILILPGNRKRMLVAERETGYWDWTDPSDLVTLKEAELDELHAEYVVRDMPKEVARLHHPERQSRANRFAPKSAE